MTPEMEFESMLVSQDTKLCTTMYEVLRNFSIRVDHCPNSSSATDAIAKGAHDLVVIEWEENGSSDLVQRIWHLPKKPKPTILAISPDEHSFPGVHFKLRSPVTLESATSSIRAIYFRMLLEYRLNCRYPVMTQSNAQDENGRDFSVMITDIGDGGIGLRSKHKLDIGNALSLSMQLPGVFTTLHVHARVVRSSEDGAAECEMALIPPVDREVLRDWLKKRVRVKKPLIPLAE